MPFRLPGPQLPLLRHPGTNPKSTSALAIAHSSRNITAKKRIYEDLQFGRTDLLVSCRRRRALSPQAVLPSSSKKILAISSGFSIGGRCPQLFRMRKVDPGMSA